MVTQLPSTGALGCDTSDMTMIHGYFRHSFKDLPTLAAAVPAGDTARAAVVSDHVEAITDTLHHHHRCEDILLWDQLEARNPACAAHVSDMRADHAAMAVQLSELTAAVRTWRTDASPSHRSPVVAILDEIVALLNHHLGAEEARILPLAATAFSQKEWEKLSEHGRASVPGSFKFIQLGFILDSMAPGESEVWLKKNLPAPIRLFWRLVGKPKYDRYRAAVFG